MNENQEIEFDGSFLQDRYYNFEGNVSQVVFVAHMII
jgi:hypothetical protein